MFFFHQICSSKLWEGNSLGVAVDQVGWLLRLIARESKIFITTLKEKVQVTSKELTFPGLAYDGCSKNKIYNKWMWHTNKQTKPCSYIYTTHIGPTKKKKEKTRKWIEYAPN